MLPLILCSIAWVLIAIPVAGALMSTIMSAGGASQTGDPAGKRLYVVHLAWFPVMIVSVVAAWIAFILNAPSALVIALMLIPLAHIGVFFAVLMGLGK